MPDMKCPFREKDGEFADCYGKACMCYYEIPKGLCGDEPMPMCRKIMSQYPANAPIYPTQYHNQRFTYCGPINL